jgi:hypothetical protein
VKSTSRPMEQPTKQLPVARESDEVTERGNDNAAYKTLLVFGESNRQSSFFFASEDDKAVDRATGKAV